MAERFLEKTCQIMHSIVNILFILVLIDLIVNRNHFDIFLEVLTTKIFLFFIALGGISVSFVFFVIYVFIKLYEIIYNRIFSRKKVRSLKK